MKKIDKIYNITAGVYNMWKTLNEYHFFFFEFLYLIKMFYKEIYFDITFSLLVSKQSAYLKKKVNIIIIKTIILLIISSTFIIIIILLLASFSCQQ